MNLSTWKAAAFAIAGMTLCVPVEAQTMYRCGKQYQDRPCDAGQQGRAVGSATGSQPTAKPTADAECAQRGSDAMKIVWAREGGATAERLFEEINEKGVSASKKAEERRLVSDVYQKRGSAPQVRAAIEADCVAEKERAAQAAALAAAAARLQGGGPAPASAPPAGPNAQDLKVAEERRRQDEAAREADGKKRRCASLTENLESNRSSQRAGGSAATMEKLSERGRNIERQMRGAGC